MSEIAEFVVLKYYSQIECTYDIVLDNAGDINDPDNETIVRLVDGNVICFLINNEVYFSKSTMGRVGTRHICTKAHTSLNKIWVTKIISVLRRSTG